jgi:hypothetical protein
VKTQRESLEVCVCVPFLRNLERKSVFKCKCERVLRVLYCEEVLGQKERKIRARNTRRMKKSFHVSLSMCVCVIKSFAYVCMCLRTVY